MTIRVLFSDTDEKWAAWEKHLLSAFSAFDLEIELHRSYETPERENYIVYSPASPLQDFSKYSSLKAVLSMWAGVEKIVSNETIKCPLTRMVDPGLTAGMIEYVTGQVLRYHLNIDRHIGNSEHWFTDAMPPLASSRSIGILGLGELGRSCAKALSQLEFKVAGWSRSQKHLDNVTCHSGQAGLKDLLSATEILVLLLPDTPATNEILDETTLLHLQRGAFIINPGRGTLINDEHLIEALDRGQISGATLDVFRTEPLPREHPFWSHPKITVTPHIAAETRPETAAMVIAENIRRSENGDALLHLVDRNAGY